jgi:ATP-dependent DNA helicase RecG
LNPSACFFFEEVANGFQVALFNEKIQENTDGGVNGGVNEGVNEGVKILLIAISKEPGNRIPCYSKKLNIPEKTIERWIKQLREENKIEFKGAPKTGGYYLRDKKK